MKLRPAACAGMPYDAAMRAIAANPRSVQDAEVYPETAYARWRYLLNLPGRARRRGTRLARV